MVTNSSQCFSAAVERIVRNQPHGFLKEFSRKVRISPQYLSDLLAGRKMWPDNHKDRAASVLGISVADLLHIGQVLIESGQFFPYIRDVSPLRPHSEERAGWIAKRAGLDAGMGDVRCMVAEALKIWLYGEIEPYLSGRVDDATFYQNILGVACKIMKTCVYGGVSDAR